MLIAFTYGMILAIGLIIPLGVQNIFVFNQGASHKHFYKALPVVLTAGICDTILILLAVSGMSILVFKIVWIKNLIFIIGMLFLLYMSYSIWNSKPVTNSSPAKAVAVKKQILFTMSISLLNPHAIVDTIVIIGTNSLNFSGSAKIAFTLACISVSFFWFFFLATLGKILHKLDGSGKVILLINKISALIVLMIAIYIGYQLIHSY